MLLTLVLSVVPANLPAQTQAYVGATLIDGTGSPPVRNAVLVVTDSLIECAGTGVSCRRYLARAGVGSIDMSGRWIIPGLIDASVQFTWPPGTDSINVLLRSLVQAGITTVRDVGAMADSNWRTTAYAVGQGEIERVAAIAGAAARGNAIAPRILYCGPGLSSSDAPWPSDANYRPFGLRLRSDANIGSVVSYLVERGASCIRLYGSSGRMSSPLATSARQTREVLQAALAHGVPGLGFSTTRIPLDSQITWPWREIHRLFIPVEDLLPPERRAGLPVNPQARIVVAIARFNPAAREATALASRVAQRGIAWLPLMRELRAACDEVCWQSMGATTPEDSALIRQVFFDPARPPRSMRDSVDATRAAGLRFVNGWVSLLHRSGVRILAGSNGPHARVANDLHTELAYLVDAGLTPADALLAATRENAIALGLIHRLGTLKPGRLADFVILGGDPLANIRNVSAIRGVVLGGRLVHSQLPSGARH